MKKESVGILITNKAGEYLLQMRDGTPGICNPLRWNFFGGRRNNLEEIISGAMRELSEELDIIANSEEFKILGDIIFPDGEFYTLTQYLKPITWRDFSVNEGAGAAFFTKQELEQINITEKTKLLIHKFIIG